MNPVEKSILIKNKAIELGFSACGICMPLKLESEELRLKQFLDCNYNGKMEYLAKNFDKRLDPTMLVPGAKSMVVVLLNYLPQQLQTGNNAPIISKYAYGRDYHSVIKEKLQNLLQFIGDEIEPVTGRMFTDSAPVLERAWAVRAGLGWIGKNGLLINKNLGSFFFIGELIIDMELAYDEPYKKEHCGNCCQCIVACPTKALISPYLIDARRCISYLTIELKTDIESEFVPLLKKRAYGCDICQDVCPWNQKAKPHTTPDFMPKTEFLEMDGNDWLSLSPDGFKTLFANSAINRAGYGKLVKNIKNALGI